MGGFGAYGKIPALGDFFRIDLPPGFTDPWDRWLQAALSQGRSALGDRWMECYMAAPIWRFTLSAGLAGPEAAQGVVMPSVDRVGRLFPLTLAMLLPGMPAPGSLHSAATPAFEALEEIALDALDDGMTREDLARRLRDVEPPPMATQGGTTLPGSLWSAVLDDGVARFAATRLPTAAQVAEMFDPPGARARESEPIP